MKAEYLVAGGEWYARRLRSRASCDGKPPLRSRLRCLLASRGSKRQRWLIRLFWSWVARNS